MIPKIIHFVWFSDPPNFPPDVQECMDTWKKYLPDYEVMMWNAKNFDLSLCKYAEEAYKEGKYAFASDYVRLWALYNYGGVYLDSDIEIIRPFDDLLVNRAFTGFEAKDRIAAWIFASEKGNPIFKEFMDDYDGRRFILGEGNYDLTPNPEPITKRLVAHGLKVDGSFQELDNITVYPMDYFCPYSPYRTTGDLFTENTYCNHHFNGEWKKNKSKKEEEHIRMRNRLKRAFGETLGEKLSWHISRIKHMGFVNWCKRYVFGKR